MDEPEAVLRPLTDEESAALSDLLAHDFPGVEELRVQARSVLGRSGCGCGCGTVHLFPQGEDLPASTATSPVPVEGWVEGETGIVGGVLLFLHEGYLAELEVYSVYDPLPMPLAGQVLWRLHIGQNAWIPAPKGQGA